MTAVRAISHVILFVSDLERSVAFYRDVLGIPHRFTEHGYAEFETEGTRFALYERTRVRGLTGRMPADGGGAEVVFEIDDADEWARRLPASGVEITRLPTDRPWGHRTLHLLDPDGHVVELAQRIPRRRPRG